MATQDDVDALHRAADITANDVVYTDELLSIYIDMEGSVNAAAARLWREKAATYATMVDTTESGSSRKLSDLHKNALTMAAGFDSVEVVDTLPTRRSFTTEIERM